MAKNKNGRLEKQIYYEERSGSVRIKVVIDSLHQDSATFSTSEEGLPWARRRRVELLESGAAGIKRASPEFSQALAVHSIFPFSHKAQAPIMLSDVFDSYEKHDLPKLTGKESEASRLVRLRKWFGERTVDQLDEIFIDKWIAS